GGLQDTVRRNRECALSKRGLGKIIEIASEVIVSRPVDCLRFFAGVVHDRARLAHTLGAAILTIDRDAPVERRLDGGTERAGDAALELDQSRGRVAGWQVQGARLR